MLRKRADTVTLIVALALVIVLTILRASLQSASESVPSTYDTGSKGYAALYTLLAREGVDVSRFEDPLAALARRHGTLVIAGDFGVSGTAQGDAQLKALDGWARRGNTLVVLGSAGSSVRSALGMPDVRKTNASLADGACGLDARVRGWRVAAPFVQAWDRSCRSDRAALLTAGNGAVAIAYRRGRGTIVAAMTPEIFDNRHLGMRDNAAFAYAVLSRGGPVAFEERIYGYASGKHFWQVLPQGVRAAIVLACAAVALAILGANLPFAPPQIPPENDERDSSEYIASLARMLDRGGAQRAVVQQLCKQMSETLGVRSRGDERARELLEQVRGLQTLTDPSRQDALAAGRLFATVQKEYA